MDERVQEMNSELISNCEFTIVLEFINDIKINLILLFNTTFQIFEIRNIMIIWIVMFLHIAEI